MIDRVFLLSHPRFHEKNLKFVVETFVSNNYSLQFIFDRIHMRLKSLFNKQTKKQITDNTNEQRTTWFVIPFIKKVTEKFRNISDGLKSKLAFFGLNKLGRIIKAQKDTLPFVR